MNIAVGRPDGAEVIELGGGWRDALPEPGEPRRGLRAAATALGVALLLSFGGAAPLPVNLVELARIPVADARATDPVFARDVVLLRGQGRLTAYELSDGSPRWSVELPEKPQLSNIVVAPAVPEIVVVAQADGDGELSVALDLVTGAELWRTRELMVPVGDVVHSMGSVYVADGAPAVHFADLRTGARLWTMPDAVNVAFDDEDDTAWTVSPTGLVTAYDVHDGRVLRTGTVSVPATVDSAFAGGGELVIGYSAAAGPRLARFDGTTLAALPVTAPGGWGGAECGPVFRCALLSDPVGGLEVVDRATGAVVRRLLRGPFLVRGSHLLVFDRDGDRDGDLDGGLGPRPHTVIDLGSGRETDVAGWTVLWEQTPITVLVRPVEDGAVLQVARLGPDGPEILAQLPGRVQRCAFEQRTLLCTHDGNQATLWRLLD
ncbi:PQQ-binding-like beta-propeller repeat protein [Catellatospora sichuanensis]|uniref:outer membrane protein assembly factor BamB family protein n=1 Tax=Catellatospora sichuanensis TaxID=1969805 RepID=UPI0011839318|nr:PQQ-binding-like beta-propeller repeat protein [Catellatospora sichuanensis]